MLSECNSVAGGGGGDVPMVENDELKRQVLLNHFTNATGCSVEQAHQLLTDARWHFETALSLFFQETALPTQRMQNPLAGAPCNTPATPPSFTEALLALHKLHTGSGSQPTAAATGAQCKVLAAANPPPRWDGAPSGWAAGGGAAAGVDQQLGFAPFNTGISGTAGATFATGEYKCAGGTAAVADDFNSGLTNCNENTDEYMGDDGAMSPVAAPVLNHQGSAPRPIFATQYTGGHLYNHY